MLQGNTSITNTPSIPTPFDESSSAGYENEEHEIYLINKQIEKQYCISKTPLIHSGFHEISFFADDPKPLGLDVETNLNFQSSNGVSLFQTDECIKTTPEPLMDSFDLQFQHYSHLADLAIQCISSKSNFTSSDLASVLEPMLSNEIKNGDEKDDVMQAKQHTTLEWTEQLQTQTGYEE